MKFHIYIWKIIKVWSKFDYPCYAKIRFSFHYTPQAPPAPPAPNSNVRERKINKVLMLDKKQQTKVWSGVFILKILKLHQQFTYCIHILHYFLF